MVDETGTRSRHRCLPLVRVGLIVTAVASVLLSAVLFVIFPYGYIQADLRLTNQPYSARVVNVDPAGAAFPLARIR
jgi:hypothetical protein